jgi:sugar lactone lactonase YvrE
MMVGKIYEIAAGGEFSTSSTVTTVRTGISSPALLSADGNGNIFVATQGSTSIVEISTTTANLGTVNVGSNTSVTLTFRTNDTSTLSFNVLTNGATGQDYTVGSAHSCFTSYSVQYCTVNVVFTPQYSGTRNGAVIVKDSTGAVIFTANLTGTGTAAQIVFLPGTQSAALNSTSLAYPDDVAIDSKGNIFVADESTHLCELPIGSFGNAYSVAIDGAGNLYVADGGSAATKGIYKLTLENGSYAQSEIASGFSDPTGVAVDASGNVYVADLQKGVFKLTPTASGYLQSTVSTVSTGPDCPWGLTVDGSGNIFVANNSCNSGGSVYKLTPTGSGYAATTLGSKWGDPNGIKVDAAGNVYVADDDSDEVVVLTPLTNNGLPTYSQSTLIPDSVGLDPEGLALDGKGNLYVVESNDNNAYKFDYADAPTLNFGSVNLGQSSAVQTVTVTNIGNAALNISAVSYPSNFPNHSDGTTDCTSSSVLTAAEYCTLSADFSPVVSGANSGSIMLTDNALNVTVAQQSISMSGTGSTPSAPATLTSPAPGSTLSNSSVIFAWSAGTGVNAYQLCVGSLYDGNCNLYSSGVIKTLSATVPLPINGEALFVRLYSRIGTAWQSSSYTFATSGTPVLAALTLPAPGSALTNSSATFQWTAGSGVSGYLLTLGSTGVGSKDLYSGSSTLATSATVSGLPTTGLPIYVRLYSHFNGSWSQSVDYVFNPAAPAALTSPTQGASLAATGQTFSWASTTGATGYTLYVGTSVGSGNLLNVKTTGTSVTTGNLPINGETIYARLWTNFNGVWKYNDYTFSAAAPAALISPAGTIISAAGQAFAWVPVGGVTSYTLYVGTSVGSGNLLNVKTTLPIAKSGKLPVGTIYARLWTNFNGVWRYNDYTFTAQ